MSMRDEEIGHYILGTCKPEYEAAARFGCTIEEVTDALVNANVERCSGCEWWHEAGDLVAEDEAETGLCSECRREAR